MKKRIALAIVALAAAFILGAGTAAFTAARHPQIHAAMKALENAARHLGAASHTYGGHRARALELVRAAEGELRQALAYADSRPKK